MKRRSQLIIAIIIVAAIAVVNSLVLQAAGITGKAVAQKEDKIVTRVVDGDTIVVEGGDRIRLLDIDTPERGEACYKEAKDRLTKMIDGKSVTLERTGENKDSYDRLLRYIFYNNTNINLLLVREGLATLYFYNKNTPYYEQLIRAEQSAKKEGLCVWKSI